MKGVFSFKLSMCALTSAAFLAGLLAAGLWPQWLHAQPRECALKVEPQRGDTGYRERGQHCEGMYVGLQSAPLNVQVISLVKGGLRYDLSRDRVLYVHVPTLPDQLNAGDVLLQGRGREANLNWALDAPVPVGKHLTWDLTEVVVREQLPSSRIGIAGQIQASDLDAPVYIPLLISKSVQTPAVPDSLELVVKIPGASAARWAFASSGKKHPAERLNVDGYFRIVVPPGEEGETALNIYWRPRGRPAFNEAPEHLRIYRW